MPLSPGVLHLIWQENLEEHSAVSAGVHKRVREAALCSLGGLRPSELYTAQREPS